MPITDNGVLVWKHVSPELRGNLNYQYNIGVSFINDGMACAGPFGAMQNYNKHKQDTRIMAIHATKISPVDIKKGIYYVYEGTPVAVYRAKNISADGADLILESGKETEDIKMVLE